MLNFFYIIVQKQTTKFVFSKYVYKLNRFATNSIDWIGEPNHSLQVSTPNLPS